MEKVTIHLLHEKETTYSGYMIQFFMNVKRERVSSHYTFGNT